MILFARSLSADALSISGLSLADQDDCAGSSTHIARANPTDTFSVALPGMSIPGHRRHIAERVPVALRRSISLGAMSTRLFVHEPTALLPRYRELELRPEEWPSLNGAYGTDVAASRLKYDVFANADALCRQLAHETRIEITLSDLNAISPFALLPGQTEHTW